MTHSNIESLDLRELQVTFNVNVFSSLEVTKHLVSRMKAGSCIINTSGVTGLRGHPKLVEYSATNGAVIAMTKSLSKQLIERGIRVNAVAPGECAISFPSYYDITNLLKIGPIYTPMITATFSADEVSKFGEGTRMNRYGEAAGNVTLKLSMAYC